MSETETKRTLTRVQETMRLGGVRSIHLPDAIPSSSIAKTVTSHVHFRCLDDSKPNLHPIIKEATFQRPCDQASELWEGPRSKMIRSRMFACMRATTPPGADPAVRPTELDRLLDILRSRPEVSQLDDLLHGGAPDLDLSPQAEVIQSILSDLEGLRVSYDDIVAILRSC